MSIIPKNIKYYIDIQKSELELSKLIPNSIKDLAYGFKSLFNKELNLVGGSVRDVLLGLKPKDWDLCTDATPEEIKSILDLVGYDYNEQGAHFGIIVVFLGDGLEVEIATYRTDGENRQSNVVIGCSIEKDVRRRDFTINGLYYDINTSKIIDLVNGINDLEIGLVRTIGNAEDRFREDSLRILRGVRFSSRFGFDIEANTMYAILNTKLTVSKERIVNEFLTSFNKAKSKKDFFMLLIKTELLQQIFPNKYIESSNDSILCYESYFNSINTEKYTIEMFLAFILLVDDIKDTDKYLIELGYETRLAKGVQFLLDLDFADFDTLNPNIFYKRRSGCNLTDNDILIYNNSIEVKALLEWKPEDGLSIKLMSEGITGKALGDNLSILYSRQYKTILSELKSEQKS